MDTLKFILGVGIYISETYIGSLLVMRSLIACQSKLFLLLISSWAWLHGALIYPSYVIWADWDVIYISRARHPQRGVKVLSFAPGFVSTLIIIYDFIFA